MKYFSALLALSVPLLGGAQTVQQPSPAVARPATATPPVRYQPMAPTGASARVLELEDWKAANATVGQYRRGHMDIVKWEKAQPPAVTTSQEPPR